LEENYRRFFIFAAGSFIFNLKKSLCFIEIECKTPGMCGDTLGNIPSGSLVSYWLAAVSRRFFMMRQPMKTGGDTLGRGCLQQPLSAFPSRQSQKWDISWTFFFSSNVFQLTNSTTSNVLLLIML
jgi:hypothetical protein